MNNVEPYRMIEPVTLTNEELRDMFGYQRKINLLQVALKFAGWCVLFYAFIIALLCF